jgi:hypothetical protein
VRSRATRREEIHVAAFAHPVGKWEFDFGVVELLDAGAFAVGRLNLLHFDDLDAIRLRAMASAHIAIALSDGSSSGHITVLAVHVVMSRTRVITQPNAEVLDMSRSSLEHFFAGDNLSVGLLDTSQHAGEVPEARFCYNVVAGENLHLVQFRLGILLARKLTSDDNELFKRFTRSFDGHLGRSLNAQIFHMYNVVILGNSTNGTFSTNGVLRKIRMELQLYNSGGIPLKTFGTYKKKNFFLYGSVLNRKVKFRIFF